MKKPKTIGKNFAGPSIELTRELSNLLLDLETYFSNLLTTNFAKIPLKKRKNKNIKRAIKISEMFTPDIPSFQTSKNKSVKFLTGVKQKLFLISQFLNLKKNKLKKHFLIEHLKISGQNFLLQAVCLLKKKL